MNPTIMGNLEFSKVESFIYNKWRFSGILIVWPLQSMGWPFSSQDQMCAKCFVFATLVPRDPNVGSHNPSVSLAWMVDINQYISKPRCLALKSDGSILQETMSAGSCWAWCVTDPMVLKMRLDRMSPVRMFFPTRECLQEESSMGSALVPSAEA